jgi:hypothetical protein
VINNTIKNSLFGSIVMPDDWNDFIGMTRFQKFQSFSSSARHPINIKYVTYLLVLEGEIEVSISQSDSLPHDHKHSPPVLVKTFRAGEVVHTFPAGDYKIDGEPNCLVFGKYKLHFHARAKRRRSRIASIDGRDLGLFLEFHQHLYILNLLSTINLPALCSDCYDLNGLSPDQVSVLGPLLELDCALMGDIMIRSMSAVSMDGKPSLAAPTGTFFEAFVAVMAFMSYCMSAKKACGIILSGKFAILEDGINPDEYTRLRTHRPGNSVRQANPGGKMSTIIEEKSAPRMLVEEFPPPKSQRSTHSGSHRVSTNISANVNTAVTSVKRVVRSCKSFRYEAQVTPDDDTEAPIDDYVAFIQPGAIIGIEHVILPNTTEWGGLSSVVVRCSANSLVTWTIFLL